MMTFEEYSILSVQERMEVRINQLALATAMQERVPMYEDGPSLDALESGPQKGYQDSGKVVQLHQKPRTEPLLTSWPLIPEILLSGTDWIYCQATGTVEPRRTDEDLIDDVRSLISAGADFLSISAISSTNSPHFEFASFVEQIIEQFEIPIFLHCRLQTMEQAEHWLIRGVKYLIVDMFFAFSNPKRVCELAKLYPNRILVNVEVDGEYLPFDTVGYDFIDSSPVRFVRLFQDVPLAGVVVTDVRSLKENERTSLPPILSIAQNTRHLVFAHGLINDVADLKRLRLLRKISGTIFRLSPAKVDASLSEVVQASVDLKSSDYGSFT